MAKVQVRRAYEDPASSDGQRVLVDRLWPRGVSKEDAALDEWCKDVAPSSELRKWYGHDADKFDEFAKRYRKELGDDEHSKPLADLRDRASSGRLTLVTATKASDISAARVLADLLNKD